MATAERPSGVHPPRPPTRLDLTAEQRQAVLAAAGALVRAVAHGQPAEFRDPTLAGAAGQLVSGAFVSLKRGSHLRSCCGGLQDQPLPLAQAVADAVQRTVREDARFPAVSAVEVEHLHMEVWLLFNPQRLAARGEDRAAAVEVGKHGLVLRRGEERGLLLPGVAVEHEWDARKFLEQTCVKAGLHPSVWTDDATAVLTFEGEALRGRVIEPDVPCDYQWQPPVPRADLPAYATFCRDNIAAFLCGATPTYYLFSVSDANVTGAILTLRRGGAAGETHFCQLSLRPGVPLQSTLFGLARNAAEALAGQGVGADDLDRFTIGVTVLSDPAMHGTVADPHLDGLDSGRRAVLVTERSKSGIAFEPGRGPEELVGEAARLAHVTQPAAAALFSLEAVATMSSLRLGVGPRPVAGPAVRPAAVAGKFYPADVNHLARMVSQLLAGERREEPWPAALIPHAGLPYSGRVAAAVLRRLRIPDTVLVIGPKHTSLGMEWAVAPHATWAIPGGTVPSDPELARELAGAIPGLALDAAAHEQEHAVEVELPLLARLAPHTRVVGIAIGHGDLASCRDFADGLAGVLRRRDERPLLLISSDMNHFATDAENRRLDEIAMAALEGLDPQEIYQTVRRNNISMCGLLPAVIVLETLERLGSLTRAERVAYATSANVTRDPSRVVGYAGMVFGG
jgi:AmmeMemoRadiSam system protein B/AmmeMemoRadiSam system protein A